MRSRHFVSFAILPIVIIVMCKNDRHEQNSNKVDFDEARGKAVKMFVGELNFLDSVSNGQFDEIPDGYPLNEVQESILFMERLTGILSEADGTYIGRIAPTRNDILKWREWFLAHRDCLLLDANSSSVELDTLCTE